MGYEQIKLHEVVGRAVGHDWSVPEFQRGFVWNSVQVRDLAESMWLGYPIGSLLLWSSHGHTEEQIAKDGKRPSLWVVDGQQRTTAFCILTGRKPYWWSSADEWNKTLKRYDIRFDVNAKEPPFFWVANAVIRKSKDRRYLPLADILALDTAKPGDQKALEAVAKEIKIQGLCDGMDAMEVYARLDRLRKIRDFEMVTVTIGHDLEEVVEIFSRLNSKGTRVTEADIYLGVVAARNPGWVRDHFLPFLKTLDEAGFRIGPNLLFRSLTAIGIRRVRFRDIPESFWDAASIQSAWERTQKAWQRMIARLREYGVLSNDPLPTETALVTLSALIDKFSDDADFSRAFHWFLQASRFGRYSGSSVTTLEEDLKDVHDSKDFGAAVDKLSARFKDLPAPEAEDFLRNVGDARFGRFLLYLLLYSRKAQDWDEHGHRLGFEGLEALADFRPQWHHIFPKKYLEGNVAEGLIDALANIAVIGPTINIRISAKDPMSYVTKYGITAQKLHQQFIEPEFTRVTFGAYETWLKKRAETLAREAREFMSRLLSTAPDHASKKAVART